MQVGMRKAEERGYRTLKETGSSELCRGYLHSYVRHTSTCTSHRHGANHTQTLKLAWAIWILIYIGNDKSASRCSLLFRPYVWSHLKKIPLMFVLRWDVNSQVWHEYLNLGTSFPAECWKKKQHTAESSFKYKDWNENSSSDVKTSKRKLQNKNFSIRFWKHILCKCLWWRHSILLNSV